MQSFDERYEKLKKERKDAEKSLAVKYDLAEQELMADRQMVLVEHLCKGLIRRDYGWSGEIRIEYLDDSGWWPGWYACWPITATDWKRLSIGSSLDKAEKWLTQKLTPVVANFDVAPAKLAAVPLSADEQKLLDLFNQLTTSRTAQRAVRLSVVTSRRFHETSEHIAFQTPPGIVFEYDYPLTNGSTKVIWPVLVWQPDATREAIVKDAISSMEYQLKGLKESWFRNV